MVFSVNYLFGDLMVNVVMVYGSFIVFYGKDMVYKELYCFVFVSKFKYFFVVDIVYVVKKLGLLVFFYIY